MKFIKRCLTKTLNISTEAIRNRLKKYDYNIEKVFTQKKYTKKYESEV